MKSDVSVALDHLKKGNVIICPTDTVWGMSCDATNDSAVEKIIQIKKRPEEKSFIVLVSSLDMLGLYIQSFPKFAVDLIEYSAQPLTIVFPSGVKLSSKIMNADGSIAIRLIKPVNDESKYCYEIIRKLNKPIVSTSANISGMPAPKLFKDIDPAIISEVDFVVPFFQNNTEARKPSRIIKLNDDDTFKILRN